MKPSLRHLFRVLLASLAGLTGLLVALPLMLLALAFRVVGWLTSTFGRLLEPEYFVWNEVFDFDPHFGWRCRPNLNGYHLAGDVFPVTTDEAGWRGSQRLEHADVVVFGDSFAWGTAIADRHHFASLARTPAIKCVGTNGYNLVQEYLWMQHYAPLLRGKLVIWFVFLGNDIHENLTPDLVGYRMPFVREAAAEGGWEIVTSHVQPDKWSFAGKARRTQSDNDEQLATLCIDDPRVERSFSACEFLFGLGKALCDEAGARLLVCSIPDRAQLDVAGRQYLSSRVANHHAFDADRPDQRLGEICGRLGVSFTALKQHMDRSHYRIDDLHWNEKGHRLVTALITSLYRASSHEGQTASAAVGPSPALSRSYVVE